MTTTTTAAATRFAALLAGITTGNLPAEIQIQTKSVANANRAVAAASRAVAPVTQALARVQAAEDAFTDARRIAHAAPKNLAEAITASRKAQADLANNPANTVAGAAFEAAEIAKAAALGADADAQRAQNGVTEAKRNLYGVRGANPGVEYNLKAAQERLENAKAYLAALEDELVHRNLEAVVGRRLQYKKVA